MSENNRKSTNRGLNQEENQQLLDTTSSSTPSSPVTATISRNIACTSTIDIIPNITRSISNGDPPNQQVLPDNIENDRVPSLNRSIRSTSGTNRPVAPEYAGSIVIPVGGIGGCATLPRRSLSNNSSIDLKATVRERNAAMLFNDCMADVHFIVGAPGSHQERISAHSYVLAISSNVFYAMFYGAFPKQTDIAIPDVEPVAFRTILKYLYADEVDLHADTVLATLYAAKKYLITYLIKAAISFLETSLTANNVCLFLTQSRLFEEDQLMQRCWELLDAQAEIALKSDGFLDIDLNLVETIISRDTLNIRETVVFDAALRWARVECKRRCMSTNAQDLRQVLGNAFYQIRIPTMDIEEFANGPAKSGLLDYVETTDVFLWFTAIEKPSLMFVSRKRTGLQLMKCHRFQSCAYRSNQWRYRGRCDSIQFSVDRRIFIAGFGLYGSSNGAAEYKATIELKLMNRTLSMVETKFFSDGSSNVFPVYFEQPVQIEADVCYTASTILDGSQLSYFGQEGMTEVNCVDAGVIFAFQCSTESTNGTGVQGGQIPELLFYC